MIDTMHLTPEENEVYLVAFTETLNATHAYMRAKEAGIQAVEAYRKQQQKAEVSE